MQDPSLHMNSSEEHMGGAGVVTFGSPPTTLKAKSFYEFLSEIQVCYDKI